MADHNDTKGDLDSALARLEALYPLFLDGQAAQAPAELNAALLSLIDIATDRKRLDAAETARSMVSFHASLRDGQATLQDRSQLRLLLDNLRRLTRLTPASEGPPLPPRPAWWPPFSLRRPSTTTGSPCSSAATPSRPC